MSIEKLAFTKDWTSEADFPTYESDATQVRKDMQCLHDETKDYINEKLIPQTEEALGDKADDDNVLHKDETKAFTPTADTHPANKKYVDDVARNLALGAIADKSITEAKLADEVLDRSYTKEETLSDETAALFGLGMGAVPDDAFRVLNAHREHWWEVHAWTPGTHRTVEITKDYVGAPESTSLQYADSFTVADDGTVILVEPTTVTISALFSDKTSSTYKNKYWIGMRQASSITNLGSSYTPLDVVYIPDVSALESHTSIAEYFYMTPTAEMIAYYGVPGVVGGIVDLVHDTNSDAYPDDEVLDGYYYVYAGIPLENAVVAPQIATGSYIGTGAYGEDNPNSLTFDFEPKIVIIQSRTSSLFGSPCDSSDWSYWVLFINGVTRVRCAKAGYVAGTDPDNLYVAWENNTVSWYSEDLVSSQLNTDKSTYHYIAIG